jgi:hypothetical protein
LFRWPFFPVAFNPHYFQPIEASSNTFDHDRTINVEHDMAVRLKFPFPAAMNREDEPALLPAHDPLHRMKCA